MLYFDNAATTKISKNSLDSYNKYSEYFFNPSSLYRQGSESKNLVEQARRYFKQYFKCKMTSTFIFTGSASESNNAVLSNCITRKDKKYIFSAGEHSSIYETAKYYKDIGYNIVFIPLLANGAVDTECLYRELDDSVALVSMIFVSNETGAINNIVEIADKVKKFNPNIAVHTDAVQALGKVDINLTKMNVDYMTLSAHKINGPKGIGALYIANPQKFKPFIHGGAQEMGLRAGTENIPAIMSFMTALEDVGVKSYKEHKERLIKKLTEDYLLVSDDNCVDNIISICFKGVRGETIQHMLEEKGYIIGTGSACNSKVRYNRVLSNIVPRDYLEGAVRISFGEEITPYDCENLALELSSAVKEYISRIRR